MILPCPRHDRLGDRLQHLLRHPQWHRLEYRSWYRLQARPGASTIHLRRTR